MKQDEEEAAELFKERGTTELVFLLEESNSAKLGGIAFAELCLLSSSSRKGSNRMCCELNLRKQEDNSTVVADLILTHRFTIHSSVTLPGLNGFFGT